METVYVDEMFLLNFVIDYFLLLATAKICALPFRRGRFALGAALGALWCCLSLLPRLAFLRAAVLQPVLALSMSLLAFGRERHLFRCFFAFLGVSALFGGAVYAAVLWRGSLAPAGAVLRVDMGVLVLSFALCWALVSAVFRRSAKNARRHLYDVTLRRDGAASSFRALQDTGNGLYDGLTGRKVLIAEAEALAPLFPSLGPERLTGPPGELQPRIPGSRLLPCAGIAGAKRLVVIFRPDKITVDGRDRDDLMVAVAPAPLDGGGSFQAIL